MLHLIEDLAKHTKNFNLVDTLSVGVARIQRNFEPMQRQVQHWREAQITDERAKLILLSASVDGQLDAPKSLLAEVNACTSSRSIRSFAGRLVGSGQLLWSEDCPTEPILIC